MVSEPPSSLLRAAPKKRFGGEERDRVHAAGERAPAGGHRQVVGARQAGDRVHQNHDVRAALDQTLGALEPRLGDASVILHRLVERGGDHLAVHGAPHVGHFLRALSDQQHHEVDVRIVRRDAVSDRLQQHRLAGLRRRDDEPALPPPDRREEGDHALTELPGIGLDLDAPVGEDRRQALELRPALRLLRVDAVDRLDAQQAVVLLRVLRLPHLPGDVVAAAQAEAPDLRLRDVDVVRARDQSVAAQEAEAVVEDRQHAAGEDVAVALRLPLEDAEDQLRRLHRRCVVDAALRREVDQVFALAALELRDVEAGRRRADAGRIVAPSAAARFV